MSSGSPARASERNKEVVLAYVEAFNRGDVGALKELFASGAVVQGVLGKGGMEWVLPIWKDLHDALAIELTVEEIAVDGDLVAVRYTERGTFRAPFQGHPPTGRSYQLVAMEWFTLRDGKITRRWGARDAAAQARQIGLPIE